MPPKISVITPTRNQAEFIEETLLSIEAQAYPNLEHIVVDALSTDATPDILARYAQRLPMRILREADRGQSDGINKGVRLATGEIACWLNSDDRFRPGALRAVGEAFLANPNAGVVFGRGAKVARDGREIYTVPFRPFNRRHLRTAYRVVQPAMFFRRDLYLEVGGLDEDLHYAMDWDLLIRLAAKCEVIAINETLAEIRYYDDTKTSTGGWKRMREIAEIGRRHNGVFDRNFLSYRIRSAVSRLDSRVAERITDEALRRAFGSTPVMVQGWPKWFQTPPAR
ncbi:MAG: glycosyltransferase family 2 protein [Terrimicrobiaceae bacterium]|nr:glycosyltransferase family 2 protein [Terrimicrobiaceae bacterium]